MRGLNDGLQTDACTDDRAHPVIGAEVYSDPACSRLIEPCSYEILSSNSSTALPTRWRRRVSATVRFGLPTYHASAEIWCSTIQSFTFGLRIPGHPTASQNSRSRALGIFVAKSSM